MKDYSALLHACEYFANKDRMNAATHMGNVKYSPLTFGLVLLLKSEAPGLMTHDLKTVADSYGDYPLDAGR